jgi:ABC-2 type transport system permease protein
MLAFSLLLSLFTYLAAISKDLNFLDQKDTVNLVVQVTMAVGVALSLLISADALSGERERGTLETLLLTPVPRRQIAMGKLLAALSIWPVCMLIAIPYVWALRVGSGLFADAVIAGTVVGALLTSTFASLGIIVSTFSSTNRASLAVNFFIFFALVVPTQLPSSALKGWFGDRFLRLNPVTAGVDFVHKVVVNNHSWSQESSLLAAPVVAALVALAAASLLTDRLRLQGGIGR